MARVRGSRRARERGGIEQLPSGALRARVYAGIDPVTKRRHYLTEVIPAGLTAERRAQAARDRLVREVEERRARAPARRSISSSSATSTSSTPRPG